jgi:flagellin-like protein
MKKMYNRKEEGVSPVIATILMVAITVVLAATVWLLVSGYMGGGSETPLAVSLNYKASESSAQKAVFGVSMSTPTQADFTNVKITLKDANGNTIGTAGTALDSSGSATIGNYNVQVLDLNGNGKLDSGDELVIDGSANNADVAGITVYLYITGYSGNAQGSVPA